MRTVTFATIAAPTAIKTSIASAASPQVYTGAALNGSIGQGVMNPSRTISVTTSSSAGSYVAGAPGAITIKGLDSSGNAQTETLLLTATGGGETIVGVKGFSKVTEIDVAAQSNTSGAFTFGVRDIVFNNFNLPTAILVGGAGDLKLGWPHGTTDVIATILAGAWLPLAPLVIYGDASTTATKLTLVLP